MRSVRARPARKSMGWTDAAKRARLRAALAQ